MRQRSSARRSSSLRIALHSSRVITNVQFTDVTSGASRSRMACALRFSNRDALYVASARVDAGPTIKRFQPKDRGKAYNIMKRTSHLVVTIDERQN